RSRNTRSPRATTSRTRPGPFAMNACRPILIAPATPCISSTSARISSRVERSAATMRRSDACMFSDNSFRMDKWTVARALDDIAAYLELSETNPFKSRAFERAARKIETLQDDITELVESGRLYETQGIGKAIGPIVEEVVRTGSARY